MVDKTVTGIFCIVLGIIFLIIAGAISSQASDSASVADDMTNSIVILFGVGGSVLIVVGFLTIFVSISGGSGSKRGR